jgi:hypothetical protein
MAQVYPVWRYHPEHPAKLVSGTDEDEALGDGWGTSDVLGPAKDTPINAGTPSPEDDDAEPPKKRGRPRG